MRTIHSEEIYYSSIEAEKAFYTAFVNCDADAMEAVWSREGAICVHPGSDALIGRKSVMASWHNMLKNAQPPHLRVELISRVESSNIAVHVVVENISPGQRASENGSTVIATNIYRREGRQWLMLEHHASVSRDSQGMTSTIDPSKYTLQ